MWVDEGVWGVWEEGDGEEQGRVQVQETDRGPQVIGQQAKVIVQGRGPDSRQDVLRQ